MNRRSFLAAAAAAAFARATLLRAAEGKRRGIAAGPVGLALQLAYATKWQKK